MSRTLFAVSLALSVAMIPARSQAEPTAGEKETARKLVKSGRAKLASGDAAAALSDLKAAHEIMNVPTTGLELGKAQIAAGKLVEARDTLLSISRIEQKPGEAPQFAKARKTAGELAKQIEPRIAALRIEVVGAKDDQSPRVLVDDTQVSDAMLRGPIAVNPGAHTVVVELGNERRRTEVSLGEGESRQVTVDVSSLAPSERPAPRPVAPKREPAARTNPLVYIGFGVGGAAAAAGFISGYVAFSKAKDATEKCSGSRCPPETHDDIDTGRTMATVSTVAFVIAGVGAGVGVYGLLNPLPAEPAGPSVGVWVGPDRGGVVGRF